MNVIDVQIIGIVLHQEKIAEMRTGEGKTLTITLAAYLNALNDRSTHRNCKDYLVKRDSIEMKIYNFLGMSSGFIIIIKMIMNERKIIIVILHMQLIVNWA